MAPGKGGYDTVQREEGGHHRRCGLPPPDQGRKQTKSVKETMAWVRDRLEAAPQRTLTLVGMDNVGVAVGGVEGVGEFNLSTQNTGGSEALKIVNDYNMAMPGTMWRQAGPTFFSDQTATTPDHFLVPRELCGAIQTLRTLKRAGRKLQIIPSNTARDHIPILIKFNYELHLDQAAGERVRWDFDRLALGLQTGIGRNEFLDELGEELEAAQKEFGECREHMLPNEHNDLFMRILRKVSIKHWKKGKKEPEEKEMMRMRKALLKELEEKRLEMDGIGNDDDLEWMA